MMERKCYLSNLIGIVLVLIISLVFISTGSAAETKPADVPKVIRWVSASLGSSGYNAITNLSAMVGRYDKKSRHSTMATAGSVENCRLIPAGEADLGQTISSDIINRLKAQNQFKNEKPAEIWQIMGYRQNVDIFYTKETSPIKTVEDFNGKSFGLGPAGGSVALRDLAVLKVLGGKYKIRYGTWKSMHEQLSIDKIDVIAPATVGGAIPTPATGELAATYPLHIIPLSKDLIEKAAKLIPGGSVGTVKPELLKLFKNGQGLETYGTATFAILGVRPNLSEQAVYNITKAIFEHEDQIRKRVQDLRYVSKANTFKLMLKDVPVHPGAARYYKEIGIWDNDFKVGVLPK